jgi:transcriptional regulator with XRE-family HTH domain
MNLAEKIKHLREVEGELRGLNRSMTQIEVVKAMQEELNASLSQAYLSQLEKGKRVHLTASSRDLLAAFFKVHPGYLVSDPPDYSTDLLSDTELLTNTNHEEETDRLRTWLVTRATEWQSEPVVADFFELLSSVEEPRTYLSLLQQLLTLPIEKLEGVVQTLQRHNANGNY